MKKLTSLLLIMIMLASAVLAGCNGCDPEDPNDPNKEVELTDIVIFDGKKSEYKIVIPENATEYEEHAASELTLFFEQATGVKLETITDKGLSYNEEAKYFSLGKTNILAGSDVVISHDELGNDGYKIVRKGNTLIICGGAGFGTVYGVYGYLREAVGFLAFAPDEIIVNTVPKLYLPDYNLTDIPDLAYRTGGHYVTMQNNTEFAMRCRTYAGHGFSMFQEDIWGLWAHTHFSLIPKATHEAIHPDWYAPDGRQLCLSNQELRDEVVESVKRRILKDTTSELYMLGQEDSATFCNCEACTYNVSAIAELNDSAAGANAALMMDFVNYVADEIEAWRKVTIPHRKILIGTFAYQRTEAPPVKQNEDGTYTICTLPSVLKNSVKDENGRIQDRQVTNTSSKARENVFVLIAPIYADWSVPINDPNHNSSAKIIFEGWHQASDLMAVWAYCNNFNMTLEYFDNVNVIATNYDVYEQMGAFYLYDESGQSTKAGMMFQAMMGYLNSELMWDNDQNVEELIDEFMKGYYKEAAEPIHELFNMMRNHFTTKKHQWEVEDNNHVGTGIWGSNARGAELKKEFWDLGVLEQMLALIDEAHARIDEGVYTDAERETMHLRITQESLTPRMYMLELFSTDIEKTVYLNMIDEFERDMSLVGVASVFGSTPLAQTAAQWRGNKM